MKDKERKLAEFDLKRQVEELLSTSHTLALEKLKRLMDNGSGIVEHHMENNKQRNGNYLTSKEFMTAFAAELIYQWGPLSGSKEAKARIKNYERLM